MFRLTETKVVYTPNTAKTVSICKAQIVSVCTILHLNKN